MFCRATNHRPNGVDGLVQPDGAPRTRGVREGRGGVPARRSLAGTPPPSVVQFSFCRTIFVRRRWCHVFQKSACREPPGTIAPIIMSDTR